jgi:hypothetical protein
VAIKAEVSWRDSARWLDRFISLPVRTKHNNAAKRTSGQHLNDTDPRFITNYHPYAFELSAMQLDMPNPPQSLVAQVLKVSAIYSMLSFGFALKLNRN